MNAPSDQPANSSDVHRTHVLVVGSGIGGMGVAIQVLQAGFEDVRVITRHDDFGGTWHKNAYPGCGVNCNYLTYQYSFAPTAEFQKFYPMRPEIRDYVQRVAAEYKLYDHVDFGVEMESAEWVEDETCWKVATSNGTYLADVLVLATGFLDEVRMPDIDGIETFEGRMFFAVDWPEDYTAEGDRIAVVGAGPTGIQVVPGVQPVAKEVVVFQRTPAWMQPMHQREITAQERAEFEAHPERLAQERRKALDVDDHLFDTVHLGLDAVQLKEMADEAQGLLDEQVADPQLRRSLTPEHAYGAKIADYGISDVFYPALQKDNGVLVQEAAAAVGPHSITSASGREFEVDTIVLATGFVWGTKILDVIKRRDGRSIGEAQAGNPRAYRSVSVAGAPNLFLLGGPNGRPWNGFTSAELVGTYVVKMLQYMQENGIRALEVREDAETEWKRQADAVLSKGVWQSSDQAEFMRDATGSDQASWPGNAKHMTEQLTSIEPDAYEVVA